MAATLRGRLTGTLRLGLVDCTVTNPSSPISRAIGRFNNRDHEVTIEVTVGPPAELQRGVLDGSLHIGMACFPSESPKLSPSGFMAKSIGSTAGTPPFRPQGDQPRRSHRLPDRRSQLLARLRHCAIGNRTACGISRHHGSRGNAYSVWRVFGNLPEHYASP
jgi:LysR substrate binding domain